MATRVISNSPTKGWLVRIQRRGSQGGRRHKASWLGEDPGTAAALRREHHQSVVHRGSTPAVGYFGSFGNCGSFASFGSATELVLARQRGSRCISPCFTVPTSPLSVSSLRPTTSVARRQQDITTAAYTLHESPRLLQAGISPGAAAILSKRGPEKRSRRRPHTIRFLQALRHNSPQSGQSDLEFALERFLIPKHMSMLVPSFVLPLESKFDELLHARNYHSLLDIYEGQQEGLMSRCHRICHGVCKYALFEPICAVKHFFILLKHHPKNPIVLYDLALAQLTCKSIRDAINTLNILVSCLINKETSAILLLAIHLRAIAHFEAEEFEYACQDFDRYLSLYEQSIPPQEKLVHCEFPCTWRNGSPSRPKLLPEATMIPIAQMKFKRSGEKGLLVKPILQRRSSCLILSPSSKAKRTSLSPSHPNGTKGMKGTREVKMLRDIKKGMKSANQSNGSMRALKLHVRKQGTVGSMPNLSSTATLFISKTRIRPSTTMPIKAQPTADEVRGCEGDEDKRELRFINRKDREKVQHADLEQHIAQLQLELEEKRFSVPLQLLKNRHIPPLQLTSKESLIRDYERYREVRSTLTLAHIAAITAEFALDPLQRDYDFIDKLLVRLKFLAILNVEDRLFLYRSAITKEVKRGATLYIEGSSGSVLGVIDCLVEHMFIIIRGSVGHIVNKLLLGNQDVCLASAFDVPLFSCCDPRLCALLLLSYACPYLWI